MNKKQILHIALLITSYSSLLCSSIFLGDLTDPAGNSFSFDLLNKLGKNRNSEIIYIGSSVNLAAETTAVKNYALSAANSTGTGCVGIAFEKATINGVADQPNPLHGAQLTSLCMAGSSPLVMVNGENSTLYMVTSSPTSATSTLLKNNNGVIDFNEGAGSFVRSNETESARQNPMCGTDSLIFAAVKPSGGDFGNANGGIALFKRTASELVQQKAVPNNNTVLPVPIETSTPAFCLGSNLTSLRNNAVNLYWSERLARLFIGVCPTSGNEATCQAHGLAVGRIEESGTETKLHLYTIAPVGIATGEDKIIGATGAEVQAWTQKQTIMYTSTGLTYLITMSETDHPMNDLQYACYALPLVDESADPAKATTWKTSTTHATLASKNSLPTTYYAHNKNNVYTVRSRGFQTPATASTDLYTRTDPAAQVGGSVEDLAAGNIVDIEVYNDTVFIVLQGGNLAAGIFYSQAIFDENGVIKNWTRWQRVTFQTDTIRECMYNSSQGSFFQITNPAGNIRSILLSKWSDGNKDGLLGGSTTDETVGLAELLKTEFPKNQGGIFNIVDFPATFATTFFDQNPFPGTAMTIVTGYKKVGFILTYSSVEEADRPVRGDFRNNTLRYTQGAINPAPADPYENIAIFVSGGALDTLGAITTATLLTAEAADKRYIVVGGTGGLALLRNKDSSLGIDNTIAAGFEGLAPDIGDTLSFELTGNFKNVKKVWTTSLSGTNTEYLFILTTTALYRVSAAALGAVFELANLNSINALSLSSNDYFTDVIVSDKLCLLATNKGLVRNGNGTNICTALTSTACNWTQVELAKSYKHVAQLTPLLTTPLSYEFATENNGQVYALTHSDTFTTSAIQRFAIKDISATAIDNTTCLPLAQETVKGAKAPCMNLGSLRNSMGTNGALTLTSSLPEPTIPGKIYIAPINTSMIKTTENYPFKSLTLSLDNDKDIIRGFTYHSALGSWIAYGNFGIRVCE